MGLHEKTNSQSNFLSVKHGAICLDSKEEREGYERVEGEVNGRPYVKWIKKFAAVDGRITKIEWYDREDGGTRYRGIKIHLKDGGQYFQIDLPVKSRQYDYFTKIMDNIDFDKEVQFNAWLDVKAKTVNKPTAFVARQDGNIVQWAYTRDNMGECPPAVQDARGDWDFRDQQIWLYNRLINVIIPKVDALNAFDEPMPQYDNEPEALKQAMAQADRSLQAPPEEEDFPF